MNKMKKTPTTTKKGLAKGASPTAGSVNGSITADQFKALVRSRWTEAEFLSAVLTLAKDFGFRTFHQRPARTVSGWRSAVSGAGKGFPDLLMLRGERIVVAELKVGRLSPADEQLEWLLAFRNAGAEAFIWRPDDWKTIEEVLGNE